MAGDDPHIGPRFSRKLPAVVLLIVNPTRPRIEGRRRKAEISGLAVQVVQQLTGLADRFKRIKGIFQTAQPRGARHELRDALRALPADRVRREAAFLPDETREEIDRQSVGRGRRRKRLADVSRGWLQGRRWFRLLIFGLIVFNGGLLLRRRRILIALRRERGTAERRREHK